MIWYVLKSSDNGFFAVNWGVSTDFVAPGDYDGDGKFDFAVQRPGASPGAQGTFYIFRSSDLGFSVTPWGLSNDLVVPGDYDGDAKTDPTVFRPSSATWFIARSTAGTLITQFGANGDRPIPNSFVP